MIENFRRWGFPEIISTCFSCVPVFSTHRTLKCWNFSSSYVCLPTSLIKGLCFFSVNTYSLAHISVIIKENVGIAFWGVGCFFSSFKFISIAGLFLLSLLNFCHQFQPQSSHFHETISYFHTCKKLCKVDSQMSHLHVYVFCFFFFFLRLSLSSALQVQGISETLSVPLPRDLALHNKQVSQATWQLRFQG